MSVATASRKARSWLTTSRTTSSSVWRYRSSHNSAGQSRWFVGSSSRSTSTSDTSARAMATRIRHPPDKATVASSMAASVNPRPARMLRALLSRASASRAVKASCTSASSRDTCSWSAAVPRGALASAATAAACSFSRSTRARSATLPRIREVLAESSCANRSSSAAATTSS
mmetsp:Transcript_6593/g.16958  ORF Transcript_6593/g.16958 Transcript_6593/m.16958 type:complete len:172 (-) Transcript_6593:15-530(-)